MRRSSVNGVGLEPETLRQLSYRLNRDDQLPELVLMVMRALYVDVERADGEGVQNGVRSPVETVRTTTRVLDNVDIDPSIVENVGTDGTGGEQGKRPVVHNPQALPPPRAV